MSDLDLAQPVQPVESVSITFTVHVPKHLTFGVQIDDQGKLWPGVGLSLTRLLPARDLITAGCDVKWKTQGGNTLDKHHALDLIDRRQAELDAGAEPPTFPGSQA